LDGFSPDSGAVVNWSSSFEVHHTQPEFNDPAALRRAFLSSVPRVPVNEGTASAPNTSTPATETPTTTAGDSPQGSIPAVIP